MNSDSPNRVHALDNLRALAMFTGVLFHSALAHSPMMERFYPAADRAQSPVIDILIWLPHQFRMPLFFAISGYFAALLLERGGFAGLLRNRLRRVAVPFILLWPSTHLFMAWSTEYAAAVVAHPSQVLQFIHAAQAQGVAVSRLTTNHLWFLYYLLYFYALLWIGITLTPSRWTAAVRCGNLTAARVAFVLIPVLTVGLISVSMPFPAPDGLLPKLWALSFFGSFFALGYLARRHIELIESCRVYAGTTLAIGLLAYAAFLSTIASRAIVRTSYETTWLQAGCAAVVSVSMTLASLGWCQRLLSRESRLLRYFADTSFWLYVAHLPVLLAVQYALMDLDWGWQSKIFVAVTTTVALCLSSFHWLTRSALARRWLLGIDAKTVAQPDPNNSKSARRI